MLGSGVPTKQSRCSAIPKQILRVQSNVPSPFTRLPAFPALRRCTCRGSGIASSPSSHSANDEYIFRFTSGWRWQSVISDMTTFESGSWHIQSGTLYPLTCTELISIRKEQNESGWLFVVGVSISMDVVRTALSGM